MLRSKHDAIANVCRAYANNASLIDCRFAGAVCGVLQEQRVALLLLALHVAVGLWLARCDALRGMPDASVLRGKPEQQACVGVACCFSASSAASTSGGLR
jgi:hypothetical protein